MCVCVMLLVCMCLLLLRVAGLGLLDTTDLLGSVLAFFAQLSRCLFGLGSEASLLTKREYELDTICEVACVLMILTRTSRNLGSNFIDSRESYTRAKPVDRPPPKAVRIPKTTHCSLGALYMAASFSHSSARETLGRAG